MKKHIIFSLVFLIAICGYSQNFTYQIFRETNVAKSSSLFPWENGFNSYELSKTRSGFNTWVGLSKRLRSIEAIQYDQNFKEQKTEKIFGGEERIIQNTYDFFSFGGKQCLIYLSYKAEKEAGPAKLVTFDNATMKETKEVIAMDFEKNQMPLPFKMVADGWQPYQFRVSHNSKKLLVYAVHQFEKEKPIRFVYNIFDENLNIIKEEVITFKEKNVSIYSVLCDDDGNLILVYWASDDNPGYRRKRDPMDSEKTIDIIPFKGTRTKTPFRLEGITLKGLGMVFSQKQDKIFIGGIYSEDVDENYIGTYFTSIDRKTWKMAPFAKHEFPEQILKKIDKDGFAKSGSKNQGLYKNFQVFHALRGDGTFDLMLHYLRYDAPVSYSGSGYGQSEYTGGDFLDVHFVNDKPVYAIIPKHITSGGDFYLKFSLYSIDEDLSILYNDNKNNVEKDLDDKPHTGVVQKSEAVISTISSSGAINRRFLIDNKDGIIIAHFDRIYALPTGGFAFIIDKGSFSGMGTSKEWPVKVIFK